MKEYLAKRSQINKAIDDFDYVKERQKSLETAIAACVEKGGDADADGALAPPIDYFDNGEEGLPIHFSEFVTDHRTITPAILAKAIFNNGRIFVSNFADFNQCDCLLSCEAKINEKIGWLGADIKILTGNDGHLRAVKKFAVEEMKVPKAKALKHVEVFHPAEIDEAAGKLVFKKGGQRGGIDHFAVCRHCWTHDVFQLQLLFRPATVEVPTKPYGTRKQIACEVLEFIPHDCMFRPRHEQKQVPMVGDKKRQEVELPVDQILGTAFDRWVEFSREFSLGHGEHGEVSFPGKEITVKGKQDYRKYLQLFFEPGLHLLSRQDFFNFRVRTFVFDMQFSDGRVKEFSGLEETYSLGYHFKKKKGKEIDVRVEKEIAEKRDADKEVKPHLSLGEVSLISHGHPRPTALMKESERDASNIITFKSLREEEVPEDFNELPHQDKHYDGTRHAETGVDFDNNPELVGKLLPWSAEIALDDYAKIVYGLDDGGSCMAEVRAGNGHNNTLRFRHDMLHCGYCFIGKELGVHLRLHQMYESRLHPYSPGKVDVPGVSLTSDVSKLTRNQKLELLDHIEGRLEEVVDAVLDEPSNVPPEFGQKLALMGNRLLELEKKFNEAKSSSKKRGRRGEREAQKKRRHS